MRRKGAHGFTLMELLIVFMIVGILATMAVARYMYLRDKSFVAAATYDLDLVRKLLAYYAADHDTYPQHVANWQDLQNQLVDNNGQSYGELPLANTFTWLSYALDQRGEYLIRVQAIDHNRTILTATPDAIFKE